MLEVLLNFIVEFVKVYFLEGLFFSFYHIGNDKKENVGDPAKR